MGLTRPTPQDAAPCLCSSDRGVLRRLAVELYRKLSAVSSRPLAKLFSRDASQNGMWGRLLK